MQTRTADPLLLPTLQVMRLTKPKLQMGSPVTCEPVDVVDPATLSVPHSPLPPLLCLAPLRGPVTRGRSTPTPIQLQIHRWRQAPLSVKSPNVPQFRAVLLDVLTDTHTQLAPIPPLLRSSFCIPLPPRPRYGRNTSLEPFGKESIATVRALPNFALGEVWTSPSRAHFLAQASSPYHDSSRIGRRPD